MTKCEIHSTPTVQQSGYLLSSFFNLYLNIKFNLLIDVDVNVF
jgi:hypothetical protein